MAVAADGAHGFDVMLAETRRRAAAIDRYVDLVPARFYLGTEHPQVVSARPGFDPAKVKTTSMLVVEAASAAAAAASAASGSSGGKRRKTAGGATAPAADEGTPGAAANTRAELHQKLEKRIAELREERRHKQSETDKAKAKAAGAVPGKAEKGAAKAAPGKAPRKAAVADDELEAGRLSFEPRSAALPFEAEVGKKGRKVRKMRAELRKHESDAERLQKAEAKGGEEAKEVRKELALRKALQRARGEKVHDDVHKLRKSQKALELRKKKGKDKWSSKLEGDKSRTEEQQAQRKDNLAKRGSSKRKSAKLRSGFEGKRGGFLNAEK